LETSQKSVGVLTVATGPYIEFWKAMALSLDLQKNAVNFRLYVFTDQALEVRTFEKMLTNIDVKVFSIDSLKWPEATLLRYSLIYKNSTEISEPLLIHMDADMIIHSDIYEYLIKNDLQRMQLVRHPGFYRPGGTSRIRMYLRNPTIALKDLYRIFKEGGLGTWEKRKSSSAFVPRRRRSCYFAGGVWFGSRQTVLSFCETMAARTDLDLSNELIAVHNDESHLNWFAAFHSIHPHMPNLCYFEGYPWLNDFKPLIAAVDKGENWVRK
jgi:hypothetical protein